MSLTPGTRLGPYEIIAPLGAGGMAAVYLARDAKHRREVAVKVMKPEIAAAIGRDRFLREIEIAARLNHPHVVPLFDSGAEGDLLYYVMPRISGEALRTRLARERQLPIEDSIRIAREIASALAHAHQHGLVHRDIKPENVLLADGIALVADFGIAHTLDAPAWEDSATALQTAAGAIVGTAQYMSPEQASGGSVDARSDIYSLACVLYEMLCGQPPFVAPAAATLLRMHIAADPRSMSDLRPAVPSAVSQAVARALAKVPADRFQSAAQFAEALGVAVGGGATPAIISSKQRPNNLPRPRTAFIGRRQELDVCVAILAEARLLTLTGIGGSGKTRLAIAIGERILPEFPDGVWFVDLAALSDDTRTVQTLGAALGVQELADRDFTQVVADHVRDRTLLVILDSCEHVLSAASAAADLLLNASESLRILATSREALNVEGEYVLPLPALSLPPASAARDGAAAASFDAVRLFVDRAQRAARDFKLEGNEATVVDICRQLDGIPLAIELAAARVKMLSGEQIRAKLSDRFRLLTDGSRTALPRHQTLEAVIQWSYDQLSSEEQRLVRFLSVFAGGWTLETAATMYGADEFHVLELLERLVDKSLVVADRQQRSDIRYRMLETVRQYAKERLTGADDRAMARARHAETFLALADGAYADRISREAASADMLEVEHDNLRGALEYLHDTDAERYLQLAGALAWFWQARSHLLEGRRHVTAALARAAAAPPRVVRARALWGAAQLLAWQGDAAESLRLMEEALQMWRDLGDVQEIALALEGVGWAQFLGGADEKACATFEESLRLQRATGDPHLVNRAKVSLAQVLVALERVNEARTLASEIIAFSHAHEDNRGEHSGWHYLADCALIEGACPEALASYRESLRLAATIGDHIEIGFEIQGIAMALAGLRRLDVALKLAGAVEAEWERMGAIARVRFWDSLLDRYLGAARQSLGAAAAASTWTTGRGLSFEDTITLALDAASSGAVAAPKLV